jgi:hypothetical protein
MNASENMKRRLTPGENLMADKQGIVNIHGKEYRTVAYRVNAFREVYNDWSILTELVSADDLIVVMKASIVNPEGRVIGTGYAEESRASSQINRTSALENCETSAIGRALAACGFAGTEYASANEVQNAIQQQNTVKITPKQQKEFAEQVRECLANGDGHGLAELWAEWGADEKVVLWTLFNSQERSAMKKLQEQL